MRDDFSVDKFVADCRRRVQLETLRQDLEVYFKLLKNAMIELINKDYADFVNLSANLVGMDKAISQLRDPLSQIKSDITKVSDVITEKIVKVEDLLVYQQNLSSEGDKLVHMMGLLNSIEKIEQIQASEDSNSGQVLERIAGEFNELQHHAGFCKGLPVLNQVRPRISEITGNLQRRLEELLIQGINSSEAALLHRCLNSYALIGKTKDAEKLIQAHLVRPYMAQVMEEQQGDISQKKLSMLYSKIVDFVPTYCKLLCDITAGRLTKLGDQYRGIGGYDFVVRSVWPEVVQSIENNLSAMFSPGEPDLFHARYKSCMEFVSSMERQCGSQASVQRLRQSEDFARFHSHWSLPVYFQMRFQEIGGKLEEALMKATNKSSDETFRLQASTVLYSCIESCWKEDIFLPPLVHRFWKVTLQCLSRYGHWAECMCHTDGSKKQPEAGEHPPATLGQLVGLSHDLLLLKDRVLKFFEETICTRVKLCGFKDCSMLKAALDCSLNLFTTQRQALIEHIVSTLVLQGSAHLRYAQDVPRLFRRTNRDAPTKASAYVSNVLKPAHQFKNEHSYLSSDLLTKWLTDFSSGISEKYYTVVSDVLTSVKKMEESLMRLQKMRGGKSSGNLASMDDKKLSDDDKIRLQLYLDVVAFSEQLSEMNIETDSVTKLKELVTLVTESKPEEK